MRVHAKMFALVALVSAVLALPVISTAQPRVWFDEGHAQAFKIGSEGELQLSRLGEVFREADIRVEAGANTLTTEFLQDKQGLVISGPFKPLSPAEVKAVVEFVEKGGRLAVMLHIGPPLSGLLKPLGVVHSNGVIHEQQQVIGEQDINFKATVSGEHPVTRGLERFALYGSWALLAEGEQARVLARTSEQSWVDLDGSGALSEGDARQSFAVLIGGQLGKGAFVVFADDAIFQNRFLNGDNLALARNLAEWMRGDAPRGSLVMRPAFNSGT